MKITVLLNLFLANVCFALLEEKFVAFEPQSGAVEIHGAAIIQDGSDSIGIHIATKSLAADLLEITGRQRSILNITLPAQNSSLLSTQRQDTAIIVATVDSPLVKQLEKSGKVSVADIRGKWETFKTVTVPNPLPQIKAALLIIGSDKRGTIFGVHTLAEQSGQSPLHWWNDVPATKHSKIYALPTTTIHGEPSVKYRGLFINDEAPALTSWWDKTQNKTAAPLNTEFYAHVFDLLLRLKANYLWPAMWSSFVPQPGRMFFKDDPRNHQLADDYGIIIGTSHHEPMQRASNEWKVENAGPWNWEKNRENMTSFMDKGAERAGDKESIYTVGMRGENDGPIVATDPSAILKEVFKVQGEILQKYHGENATSLVKAWTVYKEVLTYYSNGLTPEDDTTIIFSDDNWGNVARLPTDNETSRASGFGLYHHLAYVGRPKVFKWQNTNNLPKLLKELKQSYDRGADRIWIINVGDIKPLELPFSFAMDVAWNVSAIYYETIPDYLNEFAVRDYSQEHADEVASLLFTHSHLLGLRKYEMLDPVTYSLVNFHEAERVIAAWKGIADRTEALAKRIDRRFNAAFYHLLHYPIVAGYNYHKILIGQGRNRQHASERRNTANSIAYEVIEDFEEDYDLMKKYDTIAGGKWAGIMSTAKFDTSIADWRPSSRDVLANLSFVQQRQDFDPGFGNLGIFAEHSLSAQSQGRICASINPALPTLQGFSPQLPQFSPNGPANRTVELFHRGDFRNKLGWSLEVPFDWIKVGVKSGTLTKEKPEEKLEISIDWPSVPADFNKTVQIRVNWDPEPYFDLIHLPILNKVVPATFRGYPEVSNYVSIEGPHSQSSSNGTVAFKRIPHLGSRSDSGSLALRPYKAARAARDVAREAWADYSFYIFSSTSTSWNATVYINGALDTDPTLPMEFSLTLDDSPAKFQRVLGVPATAGDNPPEWSAAVADHVWKKEIVLGALKPGEHKVRWRASSPEVYLEKIVVHRGVAASYLGPPETRLVG